MQSLASTITSFKVPKGIPFYDDAEDKACEEKRKKYNALRASGIPSMFWDARVENCPAEIGEWVEAIKSGGNQSLLLQGKVGRGKTYAACAAMVALMPGKVSRFATFGDILREIKATFGGEGTEKAAISRLTSRAVLCIDDFGKTKPSEWATEKLFDIINERWANQKPTIITTQFTGNELMGRLAVPEDAENARAIISRLAGYKRVQFDGKDRRLA